MPVVGVFGECARGNGICLSSMQMATGVQSVLRTRSKIGAGVVVSRCSDGVWLYNRSDYPVFVSSPTFALPQCSAMNAISEPQLVEKVPFGYSLKVYDFEVARTLKKSSKPNVDDIWTKSPQNCASSSFTHDLRSLRFSFVKGWGINYKRQSLIACPCWLELIILAT